MTEVATRPRPPVGELTGAYVQFGCGSCHPAGWLNFDASPGLCLGRVPLVGGRIVSALTPFSSDVLFGDIVKGLPVKHESVVAVFSSHVIEHLSREQVPIAFRNIHSMLVPGGVFRSVLPDISKLARAYLEDPDPEAGLRFVSSTGLVPAEAHGLLPRLRRIIGHSEHRWMWDFNGLAWELRKAGFRDIREAKFGDSRIAAMRDVEEPSRFEYAVCFEATK